MCVEVQADFSKSIALSVADGSGICQPKKGVFYMVFYDYRQLLGREHLCYATYGFAPLNVYNITKLVDCEIFISLRLGLSLQIAHETTAKIVHIRDINRFHRKTPFINGLIHIWLKTMA